MTNLRLGLDVGSTTVKLVVLNSFYQTVYRVYKRHYPMSKRYYQVILAYARFKNYLCGNGLGICQHKWLDIPFIQEVMASTNGIRFPETDVAIELVGGCQDNYLPAMWNKDEQYLCQAGPVLFSQMAAFF